MRRHPLARPYRLLLVLLLLPLVLLAACGDDDPVAPPAGETPGPLRFETYQAADVVIGQKDGESTAVNASVGTTPWSLNRPSGIAGNADAIYVADRFNFRLLVYPTVPTLDGLPAGYAVGQIAMTTRDEAVSASRFVPFDCDVSDGRLFVADNGANRVLIWNTLPDGDVPADVVVGQTSFTENGHALSDSTMWGPTRVRAAGGRLFVLETSNARCLIWNSIPTTDGAPADVVVGAPDFTTFVGGTLPSEFGFGTALWTDGTRLAIGDGTNKRVLIWNSIPTTNGAPADVVIGAPDFTTVDGTPETGLGNPAGLASDGHSLFVLDSANNRLLIYTPFPTANGQLPSAVIGQPDLASIQPNDDADAGGPSRRVFQEPRGIRIVGRQLLVADSENNRVLVFNSR